MMHKDLKFQEKQIHKIRKLKKIANNKIKLLDSNNSF